MRIKEEARLALQLRKSLEFTRRRDEGCRLSVCLCKAVGTLVSSMCVA